MSNVYDILDLMLEALGKAWPFILISIPVAVAVNISGAASKVRYVTGKNPYIAIVLATLFGALSPLCACTVIPVIFSLLTAGVPLAPVMSFWIASPSMDPEIFFLSVSAIGWRLAVWRITATFFLSLAAGFVAYRLTQRGWFSDGSLRSVPISASTGTREFVKGIVRRFKLNRAAYQAPCCCVAAGGGSSSTLQGVGGDQRGDTCGVKPAVQTSAGTADDQTFQRSAIGTPLFRRIVQETGTSLWFVGRFMILAFFLEALIVLYVPDTLVSQVLGQEDGSAVLWATLFGLPFYTTNIAALGLLGGLLQQGMLPAAALAFLISGPMTTLPAMSAVFSVARRRVFVYYLSVALGGALFFGLLFQLLG